MLQIVSKRQNTLFWHWFRRICSNSSIDSRIYTFLGYKYLIGFPVCLNSGLNHCLRVVSQKESLLLEKKYNSCLWYSFWEWLQSKTYMKTEEDIDQTKGLITKSVGITIGLSLPLYSLVFCQMFWSFNWICGQFLRTEKVIVSSKQNGKT